MNLTPHQAEAVAHRGGDLLVSASAGSGKTEVLARRGIALIGDDLCHVDQLLAVTFTRAAAAELRVRIAGKLHEMVARADLAPQQRDHLMRQAILVDSADICTLDSWCGRIVREHFATAGVDPDFTTLDQEQARLLRQQMLDEVFESVYDGTCEITAEVGGWLARHVRPSDGFLRAMVLELDRFLGQLVSPASWLAEQLQLLERDDGTLIADARATLAAALAGEIEQQRQGLASVLKSAANGPVADRLQAYHDSLTIWHERLSARAESLLSVLEEIPAFELRPGSGKKKLASTPLLSEIEKHWHGKRLKERWNREDIESMIAAAPRTSLLVRTLLRLTATFRHRLAEAKRERAAYEFADVERMALDLLGQTDDAGVRHPTPIAQQLRRRYAHILVDEYQDTSPVQAELLRLIAREGAASSRFMVGDVKQSIYGFRQAEPRLFAELMRQFECGELPGRVLHLSDNFRSHERLLDGLNALFSMLFDPGLGGSRYGVREALRAGRGDIANPSLDGESRIEIHVLEAESRRRRADDASDSASSTNGAVALDRVEREAVLAADRIREMLASGTRVPQRTADGSLSLRPLAKSDIVILLRSAKVNAARVAAVLRDAGIACVTAGRESLLDSVEVRDVLNVLDLLANRRQDVPMAGYLRGPLVGMTPADLLAIHHAAPRSEYSVAVQHYAECGDNARLKAKAVGALAQLDRWCAAARNFELPALLRQIYRDGALDLFARALPGGRHRVGMLRALQRYAANFAASGHQGVSEFIDYLEDLSDRQLDLETAAAVGKDAVRIMTIHAAKGLEFPVVFLLNAGAEFSHRPSAAALRCDRELGIGLNFLDYPARTRLVSPQHHLLKHAAALNDREEEMRLLYVAATRAREKLFIIGHAKPNTYTDIAARCDSAGARPPLVSLQLAGSTLEWCLWGAASSGCDQTGASARSRSAPVSLTVRKADEIAPSAPPDAAPATAATTWTEEDERWVEQAAGQITAEIDHRGATMPAVLSASAIKSRAFDAVGEENAVPQSGVPRVGLLRQPGFVEVARPASGQARSGAEVGTAVHQFMQHTDLSRLRTADEVRGQLAALVAAGRFGPGEAELVTVDDIVWFASTTLGKQLAAAGPALRRELPFVFSVPAGLHDDRVLVRGVIDCLLESESGITIVDYKTDRVSGERALESRLAGYRSQIQIYAWAAAEIARKPVVRGLLVFLNTRRVIDVPLERPRIDLLFSVGESER